jgi:DnaJ-class molecular chaperone
MRVSIRQNRYDNWYGYVGGRRVEQFFASSGETQQQAAERWLSQREREIASGQSPEVCGRCTGTGLRRRIGMPAVEACGMCAGRGFVLRRKAQPAPDRSPVACPACRTGELTVDPEAVRGDGGARVRVAFCNACEYAREV